MCTNKSRHPPSGLRVTATEKLWLEVQDRAIIMMRKRRGWIRVGDQVSMGWVVIEGDAISLFSEKMKKMYRLEV